MIRIVPLCVVLGFSTLALSVSASPSPVTEPLLPQASKPVVVYAAWNDLMHKALDGDAASAAELGKIYAHGSGAPHDVAEAMRWLTRAADLGSNEARRELGLLLVRGDGTQKDADHAAMLLRQAAEAGDPKAQAALGVMYAYGDGVPQDGALAVDWSRKAADRGDPWGQANYGLYLETGKAGPD